MKYNCNICQYSTAHKHLLSEHTMSMHFSQKFPCKTCPYKATLAGNLSKHIKRVHNTIESIQCTECNKTLKASDLSYHRRFFHSGKESLFNCNTCSYQTNREQNLKNHMRSKHSAKRK